MAFYGIKPDLYIQLPTNYFLAGITAFLVSNTFCSIICNQFVERKEPSLQMHCT